MPFRPIAATGVLAIFLLMGCSGSGGGSSQSTPPPPPPPPAPPATGLPSALAVCSTANPCTRPAPGLGGGPIVTPSFMPVCRTQEAGRPLRDDGPPVHRVDETGVDRYACRYQPPETVPGARYPLVVFLHGGGTGTATSIYDFTSLRLKAESFALGDAASPTGFFLLSIQGRNLHYPTGGDRDGRHHDFYFRDLRSPSANSDIANLDLQIDTLVATGRIDPRRIYVIGWSNGGFFGQMYAIARHVTPTPGGNRVAAVVPYTAGDPFNNTNRNQVPSYQLDPYPTSTVPIFLVSRACDIVACSAAQSQAFETMGFLTEPGHIVETWALRDLPTKVRNPNVWWRIVGGNGLVAGGCSPSAICTPEIGLLNHLRWPDGVADGSGADHEGAMLEFLRAHPLP